MTRTLRFDTKSSMKFSDIAFVSRATSAAGSWDPATYSNFMLLGSTTTLRSMLSGITNQPLSAHGRGMNSFSSNTSLSLPRT